jgi:hypothetical protein
MGGCVVPPHRPERLDHASSAHHCSHAPNVKDVADFLEGTLK